MTRKWELHGTRASLQWEVPSLAQPPSSARHRPGSPSSHGSLKGMGVSKAAPRFLPLSYQDGDISMEPLEHHQFDGLSPAHILLLFCVLV